ncbi:MAG: methylenetetrahydrofolate reductase [NAD(P)H] [Candidatus Omnitrophica bacterium CG12_big_fil_rev_8_21_14_0_65_50_5]|nr:MAG: methylenetetrahydrofolate reductase [NAD(P)H] [Candidatus Omnitrophica bacterium CG12_big_fil_rev_8_21_14_0_65_50_5]
MFRISDIFSSKAKTVSFELFPPKTDEAYIKLLSTIDQLCTLKPDFISVTYGAGGGSRKKTQDIVGHIQDKHHIAGLAHLTCVLHTKDEIKAILEQMKSREITNVLALRGDPPQHQPDWTPGPENFRYSSELAALIRKQFGNYFTIGVAGFPEGHVLCPNRERDADYLKIKIDAGADFVITQLFFNNKDYFDYVERLKRRGIRTRIIPGILPITNYQGLTKFCKVCGSTVTDEVKQIFEPIQNDPKATSKAGVDFCVRQCRELLKGGAPGLHFYTLNKLSPTDQVLKQII